MASYFGIVAVAISIPIVLALALVGLLRGKATELSHLRAGSTRFKRGNLLLLVFRACCAGYGIALTTVHFHQSVLGPRILFYLTLWNWCSFVLYMCVATILSVAVVGRCAPDDDAAGVSLRARLLATLARCFQALGDVLMCSSLVADTVLWTVLYPTQNAAGQAGLRSYISVNEHAVNFVLLAVDLFVNDVPPLERDQFTAVAYFGVYSAFTTLRVGLTPGISSCLVEHCKQADIMGPSAKVIWPYFFMDTSSPLCPVYMVALLAVIAGVYHLCFRLRRRLHSVESEALSSELTRLAVEG
eukprot:TRINITY_DN74373_c0_g1_i1.p1 TRINITY_DN74373_c0_g1~~TRINITY_DN74373_c0_g1_i1.p1  ORF type:complete len:316 (+),score=21.54 TRINITY_DN74373_c0_g1_i1:50-949(+)